MRIVKFAAIAALAVLAATGVRAQRPAATIFEGGRILVGNGTVIENGAVVIDNGRITAVGQKGDVKAPAGATPVDLNGKTLMPTLVDAHMHVGYENMNGWRAENYTRENVIDTL